MTFYGPKNHRIPTEFTDQSTTRSSHRLTTSLVIILLLTSILIVILPVSNVVAQPDGFEYFVHSETSILRLDDDMDGYFETARIYYDVDSTTAYAEIKVICIVDDLNTSKTVKELSDTYTIFRNIDTENTYFDFKTSYSGAFNFTLTVYDVIHNHQEYGGNDYPAGNTALEINPYRYRIIADATAYDADADGYSDDVRIEVTDTLNFTISNASVFIDGDYEGRTNQDGLLFDFNHGHGIHEVDVFYKGLHGNTDFKSEGPTQPYFIYSDADPLDDDRDGYFDDVVVKVYTLNYNPLPNADVFIDWEYYGVTNQQGELYAYDFEKGFHDVLVATRNFQSFTIFYAEALNETEIHEYFAWVYGQVVALDNDNIANDIDVYLDVDIPDGKTSNITVNATVYYENRTVAAMESINYTTTGPDIEDEHIYIYNLTNNLTYYIKCELFDEEGNLEDVWFIEGLVIQVAYGNVNVDPAVLDLDDDDHFNDVVYWAHIKDQGYTTANIKIYYKSNSTLARNLTTDLREGNAVVEDLYYTNYTWAAYDDLSNEIDNGTFELYDRNPFRTTQVRVQLFDADRDEFFDDFTVMAYNDLNLLETNVSVQIKDAETDQVVAQGFTSIRSSGNIGRFLAEDLQEGFYTYSTSILFGLTEYHLLSTGWFYSYGNCTEATHNLNAFAAALDLDGDGYKNDVRITVKDRNNQPVMNAIVFFDNDIQTQNRTDMNGEVTENDFEFGWHDVNVVFISTSPTVPPNAQAYTRFFSEGLNYDEYFYYVNFRIINLDNDDQWNDLEIFMDVDVDEPVTVEVSVEVKIHYSSNDTIFAQEMLKFEIFWTDGERNYVFIENLTYNENFHANITLKDDFGNIEDYRNRSNIIVIPIKPLVNIDLTLNQYHEQSVTTNFLRFFAHIIDNGVENITIKIYYVSNDTQVAEVTTNIYGDAWVDQQLGNGDYYYISTNSTNYTVEFGEFNIGNHPASITEFQRDSDVDGFYDDFSYTGKYLNVTPIGMTQDQININVSIYDLHENLVDQGTTETWHFVSYNYSEGYYKFIATYEAQRVTNGTFYSYGTGFVNLPPEVIISAPKDKSVWNTSDTIQFDGTASYDPDVSDTLRFYWESNISGALSNADSFARKLPEGIHLITLYVEDNHGHNASDSVITTVVKPIAPGVNQKPIANAGTDQDKAPIDILVILDGSKSNDPDGHIIAYNWSVVSKPSGATALLNDSTYVKPTFTPNKLGLYRFSLGVQDNDSEWSYQEDTVDITVIENQVPMVNISKPLEMEIFNTTDKIFFMSNGTYDPDDDYNSNGQIDGSEEDNLTYYWTIWQGNESVFELSGKGKSTFNSSSIDPALPAASYIVNLTVIDDLDANASTDVEINITNVPAVINITSPTEGEMFRKYKSVKLDASATLDADNETADLYFYWEITPKDKTPIIFANISTVNVDLYYEGDYTIMLWVDDSMGTDLFDREHNISAIVNITVENQAPEADARLEHDDKINLGELAFFNASRSSDPDDLNGATDKANFTYDWDLDESDDADFDGNSTNDKDLEGMTVNYSYEDGGTYVVTLTITDEGSMNNNTATTNLTITINNPPEADAGADITDALTDTKILLDGSNSSDLEGDTLWFFWVYDSDIPADTSENGTSPFANATYELPGTYTAILNVFDGMAWSTDELVILVTKSNTEPFCEAGKNIVNIDVDQTVFFSGINCTDLDDDELTYTWDFGDETTATGLEVTHKYTENGVYTVTLNITDGEAYANDTITVTVRPEPPTISDPDDSDEVKNTVIISGTTSGKDITKVEVKIGSSGWDDAIAEDEDWSTWTYDWDTTDEDNEEFEIQVRAVTSYATSAIASITVNVFNPVPLEITITSHSENALVKSNRITISGTTSGEGIQRVEVRVGSGNWEIADDDSGRGDYSLWSYLWDTTDLANKKSYEITVRVIAAQGNVEDSVTLRLQRPEDTTPDDDGGGSTDYMAWIKDNIILVAGGIILLILILIILAVVSSRGSKRRRMIEEEEAARRREEDREVRERLEVERAEVEAKELIKKQPVRCPRCKEYSVIEDDGQRPLMIECVHCGANGYISDRPKTLAEPTLPKEEEEKLIIQCPKCDEMFTMEDEAGEIVCPSCGVRGQMDEETIAELKRQQAEESEKAGEPLGKEKEEEKTPEKPEKKIKCPNCDTRFNIAVDADSITCPSCGVSGTL